MVIMIMVTENHLPHVLMAESDDDGGGDHDDRGDDTSGLSDEFSMTGDDDA